MTAGANGCARACARSPRAARAMTAAARRCGCAGASAAGIVVIPRGWGTATRARSAARHPLWMAALRVAVEHMGMSEERPWWFPTAVIVAPACGAVIVLMDLVATFHTAIAFPIAVAAIGTAITDLARREDRWRDRVRPGQYGRWGPTSTWPPRRVLWRWPVTLAATMVFSGVACACGTLLFREFDPWTGLLIPVGAVVSGWRTFLERYPWAAAA